LLVDGVVSEIAPLAEPASRTFLVKIELPVEPRLRAGMFGRLLVPVGQNSALRVPLRALIQRGQLEIVYVVEEQVARARLVRSGKRSADEVEIISGLESGQQVVTDGNRTLVDGQPVKAER
jgi:RND family efflux transporter MFP subunit